MTTQAAHAAHSVSAVSAHSVLLALAGATLAAGVGSGIATLVLDDSVVSTDTPSVNVVNPLPGTDLDNGTDRQMRELMHRR